MRAALGLGALPRIVDQERVDQRQVAERGVGPASADMPTVLPGSHSRLPCLPSARRRGRRTRGAATGRRPGSGGSAAGRDRGRWRPGSPRTRAAAAPGSRRSRIGLRRRRSRRPGRGCGRRTARPAAGPSAAPSRRSVRRAGWRTTRGSGPRGPGSGCRPAWPSVSQSGSCPPRSISACISASPSPASTPGISPMR